MSSHGPFPAILYQDKDRKKNRGKLRLSYTEAKYIGQGSLLSLSRGSTSLSGFITLIETIPGSHQQLIYLHFPDDFEHNDSRFSQLGGTSEKFHHDEIEFDKCDVLFVSKSYQYMCSALTEFRSMEPCFRLPIRGERAFEPVSMPLKYDHSFLQGLAPPQSRAVQACFVQRLTVILVFLSHYYYRIRTSTRGSLWPRPWQL